MSLGFLASKKEWTTSFTTTFDTTFSTSRSTTTTFNTSNTTSGAVSSYLYSRTSAPYYYWRTGGGTVLVWNSQTVSQGQDGYTYYQGVLWDGPVNGYYYYRIARSLSYTTTFSTSSTFTTTFNTSRSTTNTTTRTTSFYE